MEKIQGVETTHRLTFSMHHGGALLRPCFRSFPCCFQRKARPRIDCTRTVSDMPPAAQVVRTGHSCLLFMELQSAYSVS